MILQAEEQLILTAVNVKPSINQLKKMESLMAQVKNWDYLSKLAIERQAGPLLYQNISKLSNRQLIPEHSLNLLKQSWLKTLGRSMVLIEHFKTVAACLHTNNIMVIGLKGILLSDWLYKEIGLRQFSDIDLLVKKKDGEKAVVLLRSLGYTSSSIEMVLPEEMKKFFDRVHFPAMVKNGVSFEIHTGLHGKLESYKVDIERLWENARAITLHGVPAYTLSLEHLLIHLCLHLDKHFSNGHIQFTSYYDIVNLLNQHNDTINWEVFEQECRLFKASRQVYTHLLLAHSYFNADLPPSIKTQEKDYLDKATENSFLHYLISGTDRLSYATAIVHRMGNIKNLRQRLLYVRHMLFPAKSFMMARYHLKNNYSLLLYYPYRFLVGMKQAVLWLAGLIQRGIRNKT